MSEHRYPARELAGDYARAAIGAAATAGPLLFVPASPVMIWILGGLAALFLAFGARTALRHRTVVRVDDAGIAAIGPVGVSVAWSELERLGLAYYSTRRDRSRGWMQLNVKGGGRGVRVAGRSIPLAGRSLRVDSTIERFPDIVAAAARAAEERRLELTPATMGNLAALGIRTVGVDDAARGEAPQGAGHA